MFSQALTGSLGKTRHVLVSGLIGSWVGQVRKNIVEKYCWNIEEYCWAKQVMQSDEILLRNKIKSIYCIMTDKVNSIGQMCGC